MYSSLRIAVAELSLQKRYINQSFADYDLQKCVVLRRYCLLSSNADF